ncbi:MAG TPA: Ig-like domain-containing protein, partial [Aggregatilineales bacterium]|nr:Ig-like domain-containing protein [Aggregatilineales bacterium]
AIFPMVARILRRNDRFDLAVGGVIVVLIVTIVVTIAGGDSAGVDISAFSPTGPTAHSTSPIRITFTDRMDTASVESHFGVNPPVEGKFTWSGSVVTFSPKAALTPGRTYTVTLRSGARNIQGRIITQDRSWTLTIGMPRVVYLAPAVRDRDFSPPNLWMVDPASPASARQLTFARTEVIDFEPSPDGTRIAYSQRADDGSGTADIYVLTLDTGEVQAVTRCIQAICQAPDWNPDGIRLAYERVETARNLAASGSGQAEQTRTWLLNLTDLSTAPLVSDSQALGSEPHWSPDGSSISVYDYGKRAIVVYDLKSSSAKLIPTQEGLNGVFAPDGSSLVYPDLAQINGLYITRLWLADLAHPENGKRPLYPDENNPTEDQQPAWSPDGTQLAVLRRYLTADGTIGPQVYTIGFPGGTVKPLVTDPTYTHGAIRWCPNGDQIVMLRRHVPERGDTPGIWVYNLTTKSLGQIADNGYLPQWVP